MYSLSNFQSRGSSSRIPGRKVMEQRNPFSDSQLWGNDSCCINGFLKKKALVLGRRRLGARSENVLPCPADRVVDVRDRGLLAPLLALLDNQLEGPLRHRFSKHFAVIDPPLESLAKIIAAEKKR